MQSIINSASPLLSIVSHPIRLTKGQKENLRKRQAKIAARLKIDQQVREIASLKREIDSVHAQLQHRMNLYLDKCLQHSEALLQIEHLEADVQELQAILDTTSTRPNTPTVFVKAE